MVLGFGVYTLNEIVRVFEFRVRGCWILGCKGLKIQRFRVQGFGMVHRRPWNLTEEVVYIYLST